MTASPVAAAPPVVHGPTPEQVTALQAVQESPCVSLLLSTTPAQRMTSDDAATLRSLAAQAAARLRREAAPVVVLDRLDDLVLQAQLGPTSAALAVYASPTTSAVVRLPLPVVDRAVVDPSFATRDLVRALHRAPRHVALVLSAHEARLFAEVGGVLGVPSRTKFPMIAGGRPAGARDDHRPAASEAATRAFLRSVDRAFGAYLALHPAPVVLVGPERVLASFRAVSRNLGRLAGTIAGSHASAPLPELQRRIRPVLDAYLRRRQDEALALAERRLGEGRLVSGMPSAWMAARHERPEMLAVDDGLYYPARLSADGDVLAHATDPHDPEVIDDAVDELIELVLNRGGWVALVDEGRLDDHGGVVLTLRDDPRR